MKKIDKIKNRVTIIWLISLGIYLAFIALVTVLLILYTNNKKTATVLFGISLLSGLPLIVAYFSGKKRNAKIFKNKDVNMSHDDVRDYLSTNSQKIGQKEIIKAHKLRGMYQTSWALTTFAITFGLACLINFI